MERVTTPRTMTQRPTSCDTSHSPPTNHAERILQLYQQPLGNQRANTACHELQALSQLPTDSHSNSHTIDLLRETMLSHLPAENHTALANTKGMAMDDLLCLADYLIDSYQASQHNPDVAATVVDDDEASISAAAPPPSPQVPDVVICTSRKSVSFASTLNVSDLWHVSVPRHAPGQKTH